jgi:quercetin dioxygenase-like cupin family protein
MCIEKEEVMQLIDLNDIELNSLFEGHHVAFPTSAVTGSAATATVYMEFDPGGELPEHTDSAEEILVALEGSVDAVVGDARVELREGQMVVVPSMVPHGFRNNGDRRARILGFFGGSTNIGTFTEPHEPGDWRIAVIGAAVPVLAPLEEEALTPV